MRALDPEVFDAVWAGIEPLVPVPVEIHPLGCHRPRSSDRDCFEVMLVRLATGCSREDAERLCGDKVSDTTVRHRRDEWLAAGVFERIANEAIAAYDRVIGLDLSDVAVDGSLHKAPAGGEGTGKNPTDRAKLGWKWSILTDRVGIPIGWPVERTNSWLSNYGQLRRNPTAAPSTGSPVRPRRHIPAHRQTHRLAKPLVTQPGMHPLSLLEALQSISLCANLHADGCRSGPVGHGAFLAAAGRCRLRRAGPRSPAPHRPGPGPLRPRAAVRVPGQALHPQLADDDPSPARARGGRRRQRAT